MSAIVIPFRNGKCSPAIHSNTGKTPRRDTKTYAIQNSSEIKRICPKTGKVLEIIKNSRKKAA